MVSSRVLAMRLAPIIEDNDPLSKLSTPPPRLLEKRGMSIDSSNQDDVSSLGDSTMVDNIKHKDRLPTLNLSKKLYGRDNHVIKLREAYGRVASASAQSSNRQQSEAVIVSGDAGAGKSLLVEMGLREYVVKTKEGFFVSGKYCQLQSRSPYAAIVESFTDLVDLIVQEGGEALLKVREAMKRELGPNTKIMVSLIPNLSRLTGEEYHHTIGLQGGKLFFLFKRLCRAFLRAVSMSGHPIVMLIDDIQWAERQSLEVLEAILSDPDSRRILVVCSFRSDDDSMTNDLADFLGKVNAIDSRTTCIDLASLPLKEVNRIVSEETRVDFQQTLELSRLIHRRTKGNCYFVIQFLEQMERNRLIHYSKRLKRWTWDVRKIEANTSATENVVRLLEEKVLGLKPELQAILKLCAYLGHTFDVEAVEDIIKARSDIDLKTTDYAFVESSMCRGSDWLSQTLCIGASHGFIEKLSDTKYKWTHDKVQTCLYSLTQPGKDSKFLHFWIGTSLWKKAAVSEATHKDIFDAAFHLNRCLNQIIGSHQEIRLAELNVKAASISFIKSDFASAASSLLSALYLIDGNTVWVEHYGLALELYTLLAEASLVSGDFRRATTAIDEVIKNARAFDDRIRVYDIKMEMLSSRGEHTAAVNEGFIILHTLGEKFPKKPSKRNVIYELAKVKLMLRKKTDADILALPTCTNKKQAEAMRILSSVATIVYLKSDEALPFALVTLRLLKLTLRYGISDMSPHGFACFAAVLAALGLHSQAYRYGCLCKYLLASRDSSAVESRTILALSHFVLHWREPLSETDFLRGFHCGMATGDLHSAFMSYAGAILMYYYKAEIPLADVEKRFRASVSLMFEYQQYAALRITLPFHQYLLNLLGRTKDPCVLEGEAMDLVKRLPEAAKEDLTVAYRATKYCTLLLVYNFDRVELMEPLLREINTEFPAVKGHYVEHMFEMWKSLVYLRLYQLSGKRAFRVRAEKITKQVRKWVDEGVVACHPRYLLLQAMHVSLRGKAEEVEKAVDLAVQASVQSRNIHLQALANECAVDFFELRDPKMAQIYLNQAKVLYGRFGFQSKVSLLNKKYSALQGAHS